MQFLLDANISRTVTKRLQDAGFDALHVRKIGMASAVDEKIMEAAVQQKRVIITHDRDFGNVVRFPLVEHCGVILLRFRKQQPEHVAHHLLQFLKTHKTKNLTARLVILSEYMVRIV